MWGGYEKAATPELGPPSTAALFSLDLPQEASLNREKSVAWSFPRTGGELWARGGPRPVLRASGEQNSEKSWVTTVPQFQGVKWTLMQSAQSRAVLAGSLQMRFVFLLSRESVPFLFQAFSSSPCSARVQRDSNSNRSDYQVSLGKGNWCWDGPNNLRGTDKAFRSQQKSRQIEECQDEVLWIMCLSLWHQRGLIKCSRSALKFLAPKSYYSG